MPENLGNHKGLPLQIVRVNSPLFLRPSHDRNAKFTRSQCQIYTIAMPNLHDRNAYFARSQCLLCSIAMPTLLDRNANFARSQSQFAHHQAQRGNLKGKFCEDDYQYYLELLKTSHFDWRLECPHF
jgi:hypothetical protein